ncbi:MAG: hypothetical protein WD801_10350 [Gemmatimonadaceae bacterium]
MATFTFSLSTSEETRQAGVVQSANFHEALQLIGERMPVTRGDTLEIGVKGFPPARFECTESLLDGLVLWEPARRLAA